jgi:hypothetical protein
MIRESSKESELLGFGMRPSRRRRNSITGMIDMARISRRNLAGHLGLTFQSFLACDPPPKAFECFQRAGPDPVGVGPGLLFPGERRRTATSRRCSLSSR